MRIETARWLEEAATELGIELDVREDYSGRGMYGATTVGVIVEESSDVAVLAFEAGRIVGDDTEADAVLRDLRNLRQDSIGRGIILY